MKLITLRVAVGTACMLAFFLHAATAGRKRATYRCVRDNGEAVEVQLRKDLVAHTALGIVVTPDAGPPWVAVTCEEVRP